MPEIIEITDLSLPELAPFVSTNEVQLKRYFEPDKLGIFIAESPKVIRRALETGYQPISFLCEKKYITGQACDIIEACEGVPIYTAESELLTQLTGFKLTQGALVRCGEKSCPARRACLKTRTGWRCWRT